MSKAPLFHDAPQHAPGEAEALPDWSPGPWEASFNCRPWFVGDVQLWPQVWRKLKPADCPLGVGVQGGVCNIDYLPGVSRERAIANAYLIAAAPELYAALEELVKAGAHEGPCDNEGSENEECCSLHILSARRRCDTALAVLRKARGETLPPEGGQTK
jgi:hypothetical protein